MNNRKMAPSNPLVAETRGRRDSPQLTYHFRCPIRGDIASWTTIPCNDTVKNNGKPDGPKSQQRNDNRGDTAAMLIFRPTRFVASASARTIVAPHRGTFTVAGPRVPSSTGFHSRVPSTTPISQHAPFGFSRVAILP